jgi:polysaccharide pyruvyl transferase WcaK-like protein
MIFNVLGSGNRGDLALVESEVDELRRIYKNPEICISAVFPQSFERLLGEVTFVPPLLDMPTVNADMKAKSRKKAVYGFYLTLYTVRMMLQFLFVLLSTVVFRLGLQAYYRPNVIKQFVHSDIVLFNGGESFKEGSFFLSERSFMQQKPAWWIYLFQKLLIVMLVTKAFKKPLLAFPNTVGPVRTSIGRFFIKEAIKLFNLFIVRDSISASTVRALGLNNFVQTSDIALLLTEGPLDNPVVLPKHTIGVSPGMFDTVSNPSLKQKYLESHARVLDYLISENNFNVVFLPSNLRFDTANNDLATSHSIISLMHYKNKTKIIQVDDARELQALFKQVELLLATRMHPVILASSRNVPFVCVIYDHKQQGLLSELGLESCGIVVTDISAQLLLSKINFVLSNKGELKQIMANSVKAMQDNTRQKIEKSILETLSKSKK